MTSSPIVILSPEPWATDAQTNKHQLAIRLASICPVLYVHIGGHPPRRPRDWRGAQVQRDISGVFVFEPPGLPTRVRLRYAAATTVQDWLVAAAVRRILSTRGWHDARLIAYFPMSMRALRAIGGSVLLYHCVDHHASFPAHAPRRRSVLRAERRLIAAADAVVATSRSLQEHCQRWRRDVVLLENVADVALFSVTTSHPGRRGGPPPLDATGQTSPVAFFHGTFSEHKINLPLLEQAVEALPSVEWRLLGAAADAASAMVLGRLSGYPNVTWLPPRPQRDVVSALSDASFLFMPYAVNEHTAHVFPLKLIEYLATGKPLLSTPLASIVEFCGDAVLYAASSEDVVRSIPSLLSQPVDLWDRRRALAEGRTWDARVDDIVALLESI